VPVSVSGHLPGNAPGPRGSAVHDHVALDEIELCCELMIAASTATTERLSVARIDEVLRVAASAAGETAERTEGREASAPHVPCQRRHRT
jgi:hypothetical protein